MSRKAKFKKTQTPQGFSAFGVNPIDPDKEPIVIIALVDGNGKMIDGQCVMAPLDWARKFAAQIIAEADAAEQGQRQVHQLTGERVQ